MELLSFPLPNDNFWTVAERILRIRPVFDIGLINPSQNSFVLPHTPLSRRLSLTHSIMILESWTIITLDKAVQNLTVSSNQNFLSSNHSDPHIYIKRNRGVYTTLMEELAENRIRPRCTMVSRLGTNPLPGDQAPQVGNFPKGPKRRT